MESACGQPTTKSHPHLLKSGEVSDIFVINLLDVHGNRILILTPLYFRFLIFEN